MIRAGFLDAESREDLIELARDGTTEHRLACRANALLLLDKGWNCERTAEALYLDDARSEHGIDCMKRTGSRGWLILGTKAALAA